MPSRYLSGDIKLDVAYQNSDQRVVASLHSFSSRLNRKFVNRFYEDFRQQYAAGYGDDAPMFENDYAEDSLWGGSVSEGGSGQGGNSRGRSGR